MKKRKVDEKKQKKEKIKKKRKEIRGERWRIFTEMHGRDRC